jgi:hypothetical protein
MIVAPKWTELAESVAKGVRRIEMRTGYPAVRQGLGRGVSTPMRQELRQYVGVRAAWTLPARRRDRLEHLGPADAAYKNTVRMCRQYDAHRVAFGSEDGFARTPTQRSDYFRIVRADANVNL